MPQRSRWVLPEVIDPDTSICFQVPVPNDRQHLAAFLGAIFELAKAYSWQNDPDHKAKEVAAVWLDIFNELEHCAAMGNWTVRLNPTDCTEVQQYDNTLMDFEDVFSLRCAIDQVIGEEFPPANPPAPGQPGEQPGGTSPTPGQCFPLKLRVSGFAPTLIPLPLGPGWTITIEDVQGATTDGFLAQYPPYISVWRCGDGKLFLAGTCQTDYENQTSDPLPDVPHLHLLAQYPDSSYRAMVKTGIYTVPSDMPDGNFQLLINNSPGSSVTPGVPAGELTVQLTVCAPGEFTYTLAYVGFGSGLFNANPSQTVRIFSTFGTSPGQPGRWGINLTVAPCANVTIVAVSGFTAFTGYGNPVAIADCDGNYVGQSGAPAGSFETTGFAVNSTTQFYIDVLFGDPV